MDEAETPPKQFPKKMVLKKKIIKGWSVLRSLQLLQPLLGDWPSGRLQCLQAGGWGEEELGWVKFQRGMRNCKSYPWERWICRHAVKELRGGGGLGEGVDSRKGFIS